MNRNTKGKRGDSADKGRRETMPDSRTKSLSVVPSCCESGITNISYDIAKSGKRGWHSQNKQRDLFFLPPQRDWWQRQSAPRPILLVARK